MAGPRSAEPPKGWALLRMQHAEPEIIRAVISGLMEGSSELMPSEGMGNLGKGGRKQLAEDVSDDAEGVGLQQNGDVTNLDINSGAAQAACAQDDGRDGGALMAEICVIVKMAFPTTCYFFLARTAVVIVLIFVGRSGNTAQLSAAALANTCCNVSGFSLMFGLTSAIPTISGKHFGAGRLRKVGHTLQLSLVVLGLACVPVSLRCPGHHVPQKHSRGAVAKLLRNVPTVVGGVVELWFLFPSSIVRRPWTLAVLPGLCSLRGWRVF